jgi:hypothetical protein
MTSGSRETSSVLYVCEASQINRTGAFWEVKRGTASGKSGDGNEGTKEKSDGESLERAGYDTARRRVAAEKPVIFAIVDLDMVAEEGQYILSSKV